MSAQPKPSWRIAPMHHTHLEQVHRIEQRAYEFPWSEGIFRDCLRAGYSAWVVTDAGGVISGYGLMTLAVGEAHVLNLCVDPSAQRQGLGRMLLEHLLKIARAAHMTIVLLEVRRSNKVGLRLYDSSGFQRLGVRKGYYPARNGREDALILGYDIV
jgi:ribosomal-protein-alanine N-acetyltransferase